MAGDTMILTPFFFKLAQYLVKKVGTQQRPEENFWVKAGMTESDSLKKIINLFQCLKPQPLIQY